MSLVSIIIPVFNTGKYLSQCFDSVLNQTYTDIEIIVVDDHSTDALTLEVLKQYQEKYPNFLLITNEKNMGLSVSRNRGVSIAKGEYFTFLDSDDYLLPDFIEKLLNALKTYKTSYVLCNFVDFYIEGSNEKLGHRYICKIEPNKIHPTQYFLKDFKAVELNITACVRLIPLKTYKETQNKFIEGSLFEDNDWNLRLLINAESLVYINYDGYKRRIHQNSIMHSTTDSRINDMIFVCYRMYESLKEINKFEENKNAFFIFYMNSCLNKLDWFEKKEDRDNYIKLYFNYLNKMGYEVDKINRFNCIKLKLLYKLYKTLGNKQKKQSYKERYHQQLYFFK